MTPPEIWNLDLADASEAAVESAVAILSQHGVEASVVDPHRWLTWHLDRASVVALAAALRVALAPGSTLDSDASSGVVSLLEDCEQWLAGSRQDEG